jgi:hypothetical protein
MYLINLKLNLTKWQNERGKQGDNLEGQTYINDNGDDDDGDYNNNNNNNNGTYENTQLINNKSRMLK